MQCSVIVAIRWVESKEFVRGGEFSAACLHPVPDSRQTSSFRAGAAWVPPGTANAPSMMPWRSPTALRPPSKSAVRFLATGCLRET
jgi:hypothetical protein